MRLVNIKSNRPIVEFQDEVVIFHNKFLEKEMQLLGIPIPHGLRGSFEGVDIVYLDDKHFKRAFKEVYYTDAMDQRDFRWIE